MAKQTLKEKKEAGFMASLFGELLRLATAGFGLAAALAWNDTIKLVIEEYIKPYVSKGSGILSQVIYALIVTLLAVTITYQLTRIKNRFQLKSGKKSPTNDS